MRLLREKSPDFKKAIQMYIMSEITTQQIKMIIVRRHSEKRDGKRLSNLEKKSEKSRPQGPTEPTTALTLRL